jgi:ubiquinone/menaquinone biosynthesis C-methylase UbiE
LPNEQVEILVVDGMSDDGTRDIVAQYSQRDSRVHLLDNPAKITPIALNKGITAAAGDIIIRMDAHATYGKDYVAKCVKALVEMGADNVGGIMNAVPQKESLIGRAIVMCLSHRFGVGNSHFRIHGKEPRWVDTVFGGCYRREVFERVGLFNECLVRGQDMEFNLRLRKAGGKILLLPDVASTYYARSDMRSFIKHNWSNGIWAIRPFLYSDVMPVAWRHLVPLAFVTTVLVSGLLGLFSPSFALLCASVAGLYLAACLIFSSHIAWIKRDARYACVMPVVFAALHVIYGVGSLWGALSIIAERQFWKKLFGQEEAMVSQPDRKALERELHDQLRGELRDAPRYTANKKYYAIDESNRRFVQEFVEQRCKGKTVLDYCCGNGQYTVWLAESGAKAYGIDISPVSIENAKTLAIHKKVESQTTFKVMDAEATEFPPGFFDLIVVSGVLHHLDLDKAYAEMARILKPDGQVIATEALRHNPFFHLYRRLTPHLRSEWETEHILGKGDIERAKRYFDGVEVPKFFHLATVAAVPFRSLPFFESLRRGLEAFDRLLFKIPGLRWQAWMAVFVLSQPKNRLAA